MYVEAFRQGGFTPLEAHTTDAALPLAAAADVIVTGIQVPGPFSGLELVRRLREDARTQKKPVVVLTACAYRPDRERAKAAGCDLFLPKPCPPEVLIAAVRELLLISHELRQRSGNVLDRSRRLHAKSEALQERADRLQRRWLKLTTPCG
jgi:CheY-like chemotaxis protein